MIQKNFGGRDRFLREVGHLAMQLWLFVCWVPWWVGLMVTELPRIVTMNRIARRPCPNPAEGNALGTAC